MKKQATIITAKEVSTLQRPLPASWKKAIGLLKGHNIDPLRYQKSIRKEWEKRLKKQIRLARNGN